jgi:hypothetical protein
VAKNPDYCAKEMHTELYGSLLYPDCFIPESIPKLLQYFLVENKNDFIIKKSKIIQSEICLVDIMVIRYIVGS